MTNQSPKLKNCNSGFTLVEALVFLFIFSLVMTTFYRMYSMGMVYIIDAKNRLGAISVASERMEIIRNMKYEKIGTVGGAVSGNIPQSLEVTENAAHYRVDTSVVLVDDILDETGLNDVAPGDYKKVTVKVFWNDGQRSVELVSRFVPKGLEVPKPDQGILRINVFSDQPGGSGISGSSIHIVNTETGLVDNLTTDETGSFVLMGDKIEASIQKYQITLTKTGYETVNTLPAYPGTPYNPIDVHASVVLGVLNVINIVQNELANLRISTVDYLGSPIPNIAFDAVGGRIMGTEFKDPPNPPFANIYKLNESEATNGSGEKDFNDVSPGQYWASLDPAVTDFVLIDTDPALPASLFSNQNLNLKMRLADKNTTSLLVTVRDSVDTNLLVDEASVKLSNGAGYDVTLLTAVNGNAFFPSAADVFQDGTYDLQVTKDGYNESNTQVTITNGNLKMETIALIPIT